MIVLEHLSGRLATLKTTIDGKAGQHRLLTEQVQRFSALATQHQTDIDEHEEAIVVLSGLEKTWRGTFEEALSDIAGEGLSAVFSKDMQVGLETTTKRNAAFTDITLTTDGLKTRVKGAKGGSVAQVFAGQLRQLMTLSNRPEARPLLMLDEPFSMVSVEYRPALCAMLREMSDKLGFQWLFTSHEDEMLDAADVAYLVHSDGKGTPERVKSAEETRV